MAKLGSLVVSKPIKTDVTGVYVQDLPAKRIEQDFGNLPKMFEEDPEGAIVLVFNELICDKNGDKFEDVETYDQIMSSLTMSAITKIVNSIPAALNPGAHEQKK